MRDKLKLSIIIRNRNEAAYLKKVFEALSCQNYQAFEVILVDNESTDESVLLGREFGAKIYHIKKSEFSYGRALNLGMQAAEGELCVLLSSHSMPVGANFLNECLAPFADPNVAAARCLYIGKKFDLERWTTPVRLTHGADLDTIISKGPLASGCVIRKKVWEEIPFDEEVRAAEDKIWASEVLNKGYAIFSPCAATYIYLKQLSTFKAIIKNDKEIKAIYAHHGFRAGYAKRSVLASLSDLLSNIVWLGPQCAVQQVGASILKNYLGVTLAYRVARDKKHRPAMGLTSRSKCWTTNQGRESKWSHEHDN